MIETKQDHESFSDYGTLIQALGTVERPQRIQNSLLSIHLELSRLYATSSIEPRRTLISVIMLVAMSLKPPLSVVV